MYAMTIAFIPLFVLGCPLCVYTLAISVRANKLKFVLMLDGIRWLYEFWVLQKTSRRDKSRRQKMHSKWKYLFLFNSVIWNRMHISRKDDHQHWLLHELQTFQRGIMQFL